MTPEQAQGMLDYYDKMRGFDLTWEEIAAVLKQVASMRYEYAVQVGMDDKFAYAFMGDTGKFRFGPLALADWWQTNGEAADLVADLKSMNPHSTACVVRRLVGEPEVVE